MLLFTLVFTCFLALNSVVSAQKRTYNIDPKFSRWPNKAAIPYYIDTYYTIPEAAFIRQAVRQLTSNLVGCVNFVEVAPSAPVFKIKVTPYNESGALQTVCSSFPGMHTAYVNAKLTEQPLIVARGPNGCLNGQLRPLMRVFAVALGRRNEHQRGDRDQHLDINLANTVVPNAYRLLNTSEAYWAFFPYDFCSITHNLPEEYAVPGTKVFTVKSYPNAIPRLGQISNTDCQLISLIYQCPRANCPALNCTAARLVQFGSSSTPAITSTSRPVTTTAAATTTTPNICVLSQFCSVQPDESTYLTGPWLYSQTLMMFNGPCVMEYVYDWTARKLRPTYGPVYIRDYFPAPAGPSTRDPYSLAYQSPLDPLSVNQYKLTIVNPFGGLMNTLTCTMDPIATSRGASCPNAAINNDPALANIIQNVSSASSQLNLVDSQIYQFVVLRPARSEIGLMDSTFSTLYQQTSGLLAAQNKIAQITAIQIINDAATFAAAPFMAVFGYGIGTDLNSAYVGFVDMPVGADPTTPLTFTWRGAPQLIKDVMIGC